MLGRPLHILTLLNGGEKKTTDRNEGLPSRVLARGCTQCFQPQIKSHPTWCHPCSQNLSVLELNLQRYNVILSDTNITAANPVNEELNDVRMILSAETATLGVIIRQGNRFHVYS